MCIVGLLVGMLAMLIYSDDSNDLNKILLKIAKKDFDIKEVKKYLTQRPI